jgi:hypothetical protein
MELVKFGSWSEVMAHAQAGRPLYYQAPLNHQATRFLPGSNQSFSYQAKGRTIRMWPPGSTGRGKSRTADPFNADSKHLDRFSHPAEQKVESSGVMREPVDSWLESQIQSARKLGAQDRREGREPLWYRVGDSYSSGGNIGNPKIGAAYIAGYQAAGSSGTMRQGRTVRSKRQPSLPGFPDIPEKLEIKIPNMPMWEQIDGDMDLSGHGGTIAQADGDHIELLKIQPVREHIGDKEAAEVGYPFWTREAWFDLSDLDMRNKDVRSALDSIGIDLNNPEEWFAEKSTPEQRALTIASALFDYGRGDEGPAGWSEDLPDYEVKTMDGKIVSLREYLSDEDEAFKDDVLGYSDIRQKLEEMVEQMADQSAATSRSTLGDQDADDAARDGFDPDTLVGVAEFGDAVGVNGDIETEKTFAGVEGDLEKDGYEMLDRGGRISDTEEPVSPEHAIRAVAREMEVDEDTVKEAAQGIDWWPKDRYDEILSSTSGYAYVYGKKDPHAHVEDGDYVIQGAYADGTIVGGLGGGGGETFGMNDEQAAISAAKKLLRDPTFGGDYVTVITRDGELVWSSRPEDGMEERRSPRRRR